MGEPLVPGIESPCDEAGVDIIRGDQLLANGVVSSADLHTHFGGVVPEIIFRAYLSAFVPTLQRAVAVADVDLAEVGAIAVAAGLGLIRALLVGISAAKALAAHLGRPLYGINHLVRHTAVDLLDYGLLPMPVLALLVSGGHTPLLHVRDLVYDIEELGSAIDDAAGEAYDKAARLLDLPHPGGPVIDRTAVNGGPAVIRFLCGLTARHDLEKHHFDSSFSGLKTAMTRWVETARPEGREVPVDDVCTSFQEAITDALVVKTLDAVRQIGVRTILFGGGVVADSRLHGLFEGRATAGGTTVRCLRPGLCTDNGAMIAAVGLTAAHAGLSPPSLDFSAPTGLPVDRIMV